MQASWLLMSFGGGGRGKVEKVEKVEKVGVVSKGR